VGLYHLAWEVDEIEALREAAETLQRYGTISGASDHGATKSIYGYDPDGNEFEIMWMVPREDWGEYESNAPTQPLNLEAEIKKYGKRVASKMSSRA
ncbi:MAG: VOC family protein, partial [Polyangiaceae bacterium]